jgi:hypothetical protein
MEKTIALAKKAMARKKPKVLKIDNQLSGAVPIKPWNK